MCLEFNCVEQSNIHVRTIVRHFSKEVAMKLHRPLREVVSVPKKFPGVLFRNDDRECRLQRKTLTVGRKRSCRCCCGTLLVLSCLEMLAVHISSPLL